MMACTHKRLKCTDNIYYCLDCGAEVPDPNTQKQEEKPVEEKKPTPKRKTKKGAE